MKSDSVQMKSFRAVRSVIFAPLLVLATSFISTAVLFGCTAPAQAEPWKSYENEGLSIDIPTDLFATEVASAAAKRFSSADGRANLVLRTYPASSKTPQQFLADLRPPSGVVYRKIGRNFFVISSFREAKIWYNRCNFSGRLVGCLLLDYPASEKKRWDGPVTRMSTSLRVR